MNDRDQYFIGVQRLGGITLNTRKTLSNTGLGELFAGYLPLIEWISPRNIDTMTHGIYQSIGSCQFLAGEPHEYQRFNCQTPG